MNMNLYENIKRIKLLMESDLEFNFVNKDEFNIIREDSYENKYGENINMFETEDGDVYFKHQDFHNQFIKFDDLIRVYRWSTWGPDYEDQTKLAVVLHLEEKEFVCNFLMGTKYEYLIPDIMKQKP